MAVYAIERGVAGREGLGGRELDVRDEADRDPPQHGRPEPRNWATFPWRTRGLDWMREIADSTIARGKEGLR